MRKLNNRRRNNRTPTTMPAATFTITNRKNRYDFGAHDSVCIFVFLVNTENRNVTRRWYSIPPSSINIVFILIVFFYNTRRRASAFRTNRVLVVWLRRSPSSINCCIVSYCRLTNNISSPRRWFVLVAVVWFVFFVVSVTPLATIGGVVPVYLRLYSTSISFLAPFWFELVVLAVPVVVHVHVARICSISSACRDCPASMVVPNRLRLAREFCWSMVPFLPTTKPWNILDASIAVRKRKFITGAADCGVRPR